MNLAGRVALVTGASQGIGRACALKLAKRGATVALVARNREKLEEVAQQIGSESTATEPALSDRPAGGSRIGVPARAYPADISDEDQIKATFKSVISDLGKI